MLLFREIINDTSPDDTMVLGGWVLKASFVQIGSSQLYVLSRHGFAFIMKCGFRPRNGFRNPIMRLGTSESADVFQAKFSLRN